MIGDPVTTRWTEALFRLAARHGVLDEVQADVEKLGNALAQPGASEWLLAAGRAEERRAKLDPLLAHAHPFVKSFVALALDRRRGEVLLRAAEAFRRRALQERGVVEGTVESARPLDTAEVEGLARSLGKSLGKEVLLRPRTNPELIGGVRVLVGARMLDRSVQGRLEALRGRLLAARLPAPTT